MTPSAIIAGLRARGLYDRVKAIALEHHVTVEELVGRSRVGVIVAARHETWRHMRELEMSYPWIGKMFDRDHTTVMAACRKGAA